jgi:hypothetical protein
MIKLKKASGFCLIRKSKIYIKFFKSNEYQELIKELIDDDKYGYAYIHFFVKNAKKFVSYYKNEEEEDENEDEENSA